MRAHILMLSGGLFAIGCGASQLPANDVAKTEAAVRSANEVGAEKVPAAQLHLKMANDQIALAQRYAKDGDEDEAVLALHRARYDAELALALAKENGTRAEAEAAREKVKQLRASAGTGNSVPPATP